MLHGAWTSSHPVHLSCWALGTMRGSTTALTLTALLCLGLCRGPQDLVQAGVLPKPSIWADPGPMVTKGSRVTILCQGSLQAEVYSLFKEHDSKGLDTKIPRDSSKKIGFLIERMSSTNAGRYQCAYYTRKNSWSERSDTLSLVVTGIYDAPSLSAQPSPVVASGENVSLSCSSQTGWGAFHLLKDGKADPPKRMDSRINYARWPAQAQALFPVGPVNTSHGGTYTCYGSSSYNPNVWSQPSNPLHLKVTGVYRKPTLSAQPGPLVLPGDNVTLQCHSEAGHDRFALTKGGGLTHTQRLDEQLSPDFLLGRVTPAHGGRYRCYSGHNLSDAWSAPSAPLDVLITGAADIREPSKNNSGTKTASDTQEYTVGNLIRMGVAGLILVILGMLLFEAWHSQRRTHSAARTGTQKRPTIKSTNHIIGLDPHLCSPSISGPHSLMCASLQNTEPVS
ncbi:leukocyte immunoglobulin-like receptor subfamily A member 5 isoform X4 [Rhinolophus sinicus]|uniref:leukocyte immunoglobulin-like receptor subfamily A member 5 isoform X4 n=1 Tax=Rhinolophus sinicus TaxID=89399 RepID=UPI003D7989BD